MKSLLRIVLTTSLFVAVSASFLQAELPPFRHDHLNIYPASAIATGLRVDGDLSDWKPEAFIEMCADPDLKDQFSLRIAFAYDETGLYVAARFVDQSPLINHVDPKVDPFRGWEGDALQVRLVADPAIDHPIPEAKFKEDAITHFTMWLYTDQNLPALDTRHGMDFHSPTTLTGAQAGCVYKEESNGYSMEVRIPWTAFKGGTTPQPGQTWLMTVQPLWGDASGRYQNSFFDCVRAAGFQFQRPDGWGHGYFVKPNEVSAKFAEQAGDEKRIFASAKLPANGINFTYTNPAKGFVSMAVCKPDGQIVRTLLTKAPLQAGRQTEIWDGLDDYGKPVPPAEYTLKALTHDGIKPRFVTSVMNSGNPSWGNKGGHYGWGADHGVPNWAASDPDGNTYLLWTFNEGGNYLIKVDATGQKQWGADGRGTAVAYDDGLVYVAFNEWPNPDKEPNHACVRVYEASTGKYRSSVKLTDWPNSLYDASIEKIHPSIKMHAGDYTPMDRGDDIVGVAASPDRLFCALYLENKIIALEKKTLTLRETYAVNRPVGLAYDNARKLLYAVSGSKVIALDAGKTKTIVDTGLEVPIGIALDKSGNLWVSVRGHQMQVLGFDPTGEPLGAIGKAGGRPWMGKFVPNGMLMPGGISIDAQNRLWVPEEDAMPKRISLWDVKTRKLIRDFYGSAAYAPMMAPDPEKPEEVYLHNTRFIVDYDKGTWRPDATVFRANYTGPTILGSEQHPGFMGNTFQLARFGGKKFAYNGRGGVFAVEGDHFKPLLYIGNAIQGTVTNLNAFDHHGTVITWVDKNGDGLLSDDEVQTVTKRPYELSFAANMYGFGGALWNDATFISGYKIFRPSGLSKSGVPIYPDLRDAPPIIEGTGPAKPYVTGPKSSYGDIWPSRSSKWKEFYGIGESPDGDSIMRIDRQGNIRWQYTRTVSHFALAAPLAKMGDIYGAMRITGEVELPEKNGGEIVGIGCYRGYFAFLNEDGLFVDQVGYDNGRGPSPGFDTFFIENFSGYFFKHPRTGKVYLFCGDVDGRILELQGWNSIRRFDAGKVTVTEAQFRTAAGAGDSKSEVPRTLVVAPGNDWEKNKPGKIALDETKQVEVALSYDHDNLYARFDVPDSSPWKNSSTDWRFVFKGGDNVDIQLGAMYRGEGKRKPQPGDVRILLSPTGQAVAMWKIVPPGMEKAPQLYTSPTGEERFERIALLQNVACKVESRADGYKLVATIPWKELGMASPSKFSQLQGDVGVLLSDAGGTRMVLRRYLFNQDTGIVNDIPNEVRVLDSNWGTLVFE